MFLFWIELYKVQWKKSRSIQIFSWKVLDLIKRCDLVVISKNVISGQKHTRTTRGPIWTDREILVLFSKTKTLHRWLFQMDSIPGTAVEISQTFHCLWQVVVRSFPCILGRRFIVKCHSPTLTMTSKNTLLVHDCVFEFQRCKYLVSQSKSQIAWAPCMN